jgi:N-dimethylarginine dimethylaminohydrolase
MGDTILVGYSANRAMGSSPKGVEWLRHTLKLLGIERKVVGIPLDSIILHLDIVMSLHRPGLAIVADLPFPDGTFPFLDGLPEEPFRGWVILNVSVLAGQYMAANCLPINTNFIAMANNSLAPQIYQDKIPELHQKARDNPKKRTK